MVARVTRNILIILLATVGAVFGLSGCKSPYAKMELNVSSQEITINLPESGTAEQEITATITGVDEDINKDIGLSFDDQQNVITASITEQNDGQSKIKIVAQKPGTAILTLRSFEGEKSATVTVNVVRAITDFTISSSYSPVIVAGSQKFQFDLKQISFAPYDTNQRGLVFSVMGSGSENVYSLDSGAGSFYISQRPVSKYVTLNISSVSNPNISKSIQVPVLSPLETGDIVISTDGTTDIGTNAVSLVGNKPTLNNVTLLINLPNARENYVAYYSVSTDDQNYISIENKNATITRTVQGQNSVSVTALDIVGTAFLTVNVYIKGFETAAPAVTRTVYFNVTHSTTSINVLSQVDSTEQIVNYSTNGEIDSSSEELDVYDYYLNSRGTKILLNVLPVNASNKQVKISLYEEDGTLIADPDNYLQSSYLTGNVFNYANNINSSAYIYLFNHNSLNENIRMRFTSVIDNTIYSEIKLKLVSGIRSVTLSTSALSVTKGLNSGSFNVTVNPAGSDITQIRTTVLNSSILSVATPTFVSTSESGDLYRFNVSGLIAGNSTVTLNTLNGLVASLNVTVYVPLEDMTLSMPMPEDNADVLYLSTLATAKNNQTLQSSVIALSKSIPLSVSLYPVDAQKNSITYSVTSGQGIVSIANGVIRALNEGTAQISVSASYGVDSVITRTFYVTVYNPIVAIYVNRTTVTLKNINTLGYFDYDKAQAEITVTALRSLGSITEDITADCDYRITNSSGTIDSTIVSVSGGIITGIKQGEVNILISFTEGDTLSEITVNGSPLVREFNDRTHYQTCSVTVTDTVKVTNLSLNNVVVSEGLYYHTSLGAYTENKISANVYPTTAINTGVIYAYKKNSVAIADVLDINKLKNGTVTPYLNGVVTAGKTNVYVIPQGVVKYYYGVNSDFSSTNFADYAEYTQYVKTYIAETGIYYLTNSEPSTLLDNMFNKIFKITISANFEVVVADGLTYDTAYQIKTADDLNNVRNGLDKYYIIKNDINLVSYTNWTPIGTAITPFTGKIFGSFNKNNVLKYSKITNLNIQKTLVNTGSADSSYIGLFGYVGEGAIICDIDVYVSQFTINASNYTSADTVYAGVIAGFIAGSTSPYTDFATIDEEYAVTDSAIIYNGGATYVANNLSKKIIEYTGTNSSVYIGGLVGFNAGVISNLSDIALNVGSNFVNTNYLYSAGNIIINSTGLVNAGGLVGYNDSTALLGSSDKFTINTTTNDITIIKTSKISAEINTDTNITVSNSVTSNSSAGGLSGVNAGIIMGANAQANITGLNNIGGLVGVNNEKLYNASSTSQLAGSLNIGGAVGVNNDTIYNTDFIAYDNIESTGISISKVVGINNVGGLVGYNNAGTILYGSAISYFQNRDINDGTYFGDVVVNNGVDTLISAGGLVGLTSGNSIIEQSYADINTQIYSASGATTTAVGGLIGSVENGGTITEGSNLITVNNVYSGGIIKNILDNSILGGLIGYVFDGLNATYYTLSLTTAYTVTQNYTGATSTVNASIGSTSVINSPIIGGSASQVLYLGSLYSADANATSVTDSELRDSSFAGFNGWNFATYTDDIMDEGTFVWDIYNSYPVLLKPENTYTNTTAPDVIVLEINTEADAIRTNSNSMVLFYDSVDVENNTYSIEELVYIYYGYTDEFDEIVSMFISSDFSMSILSGDLVIGIDGKNITIKTTGTADIKIKANKDPTVYEVLQISVLPKISSIIISDENGNDITLDDFNTISMRKDSLTQLKTSYLDESGNLISNLAFGVIYSSDDTDIANVINGVPAVNNFGSYDMQNWVYDLYYLPASPNAIIESADTLEELTIANFIAMPVVIATFNDLINGGTYSVYVPIRDFVQDSSDIINFEVQLVVGATMIDVTPYDNEIEKIQTLNLTATVYTDNIAVDTESDYLGRANLYGSNIVEGYEGFALSTDKTKIEKDGNTYLTITEGTTELLSGQLITGFNIAISDYFTEQIEESLQIELLFTPLDNLDAEGNVIDETLIKTIKITVNPQQVLRADITHFAGGEIVEGSYNAEYATTTIVNSQNGLLKIFTYPLYADYDGVDLESSTITQGGQQVAIQFEQRIASYFNSYYYQQPNTSAIDINNGITLRKFSYIYTENDVSTNTFNGWFYVRTLLPTKVDLGTQFIVTATFYKLDESSNKQTVYIQRILLVTAQMPGVSFDFEQEYVARGTSIVIDLQTSGVTGDAAIAAFSSEIYEPDEYAELHSVAVEKINNVWYLKVGPSVKAGTIVTVQASISEYVNGILETKITQKQITVADFIINGMTEETVGTGSVYRMQTGSPRSLKVLLITERYIYDENAYSAIDSAYQINIENEIQNQISALENQYSTLLNTLGTLSQVWKRLSIDINETLTINDLVSDEEYFSVRFDTSNYTIITPIKVNTVDILVRGEIEYAYYEGVPYMVYVNGEGDSVINVDDTEIEVSVTYTQNKDFNFDFWLNTTEDSPQPITTAEELKNMSAGANYILTNDIVITEAWTPLQVDIAMLDGNSYKIYFENFDETMFADDTVATIGLFSQINSGTVLKNITIALPATLEINATAFTSVTFGMLVAINNGGVITNCAIISEYQDLSNNTQHTTNIVVNTADTISTNVVSTLVGGLVGSNSGFISNSRVGGYTELYRLVGTEYVTEEILSTINIFAKGSIGGFVGVNTQTVSNSFYANGTIENTSTYIVNAFTSGFVENNSGTIFGCYAEGLAGSYTLGEDVKKSNPTLTEGGIKTYGDAGGFVYFNSGTITNSYSNIPILARRAGGFAYENRNTGTIDQTYSLSLLIESERSDYYGPFIGRNNLNVVNNDSTCTVSNSYYRDIGYTATDEVGIRVDKLDFSNNDVFVGFGFSGSMTSFVEGGSIWIMESIDANRLAELQAMDANDKTTEDILAENLLELIMVPKLVSADSIAVSLRMPITTETIVQGESYTYYYPVPDTTAGTVNNPILIKTAEEFNQKIIKNADYVPATETVAAYVKFDKYIRIIANLDFNNYTTINTNVKGDTLRDINNDEVTIYTQGMLTMGIVFKGNLDGNGMTMLNVKFASVADTFALQDTLTNYNLRPYAKLSSTERGIFARIEGGVVKNLKIISSGSMGASNITSVGALAGVIKDSVVLNIKLSGSATSTSQTDIYGNNYAGGLAGRIIGTSIIMNITSNLSVSATYSTSDSGNVIVEGNQTYVIYSSYQDENLGYALKTDVSYAGGIAGIINIVVRDMSTVKDGVLSTGKIITGTTIDDPYIQRLTVSGAITISGETAGGIAGLIGSNTFIKDIAYETTFVEGEASAKQIIMGYNYTGGIAGENRGKIDEARVQHTEAIQKAIESTLTVGKTTGTQGLFAASTNARISNNYVGGLVGYNTGNVSSSGEVIGGIITNSYCKVDVINTSAKVAGGLIGYNSGGKLEYVYASGSVLAKNIIGGIIGYNQNDSVQKQVLNHVVAINNWHTDVTINTIGVVEKNIYYMLRTMQGIIVDGKNFGDSSTYTTKGNIPTSIGAIIGYNTASSVNLWINDGTRMTSDDLEANIASNYFVSTIWYGLNCTGTQPVLFMPEIGYQISEFTEAQLTVLNIFNPAVNWAEIGESGTRLGGYYTYIENESTSISIDVPKIADKITTSGTLNADALDIVSPVSSMKDTVFGEWNSLTWIYNSDDINVVIYPELTLGNNSNVFIIRSQEDLSLIQHNLKATYLLDFDINPETQQGELVLDDSYVWTPLGTSTSAFKGKFKSVDTTVQVIKNIHIKDTINASHGLFTYVTGAQFAYVGFEIASMSSTNAQYFGVLAGYAQKSTFTNVTVSGKEDTTTIYSEYQNANHNVGGLVGYSSDTQYNNTYSKININVSSYINNKLANVGGLVGYTKGGTINFSKSLNNIITVLNTSVIETAMLNVGGLIGLAEGFKTITQSFSESKLAIGQAFNINIGGLIGKTIGNGEISDSYASNVKVGSTDYEYSIDLTDILNASLINAGGLIGYANNGVRVSGSSSNNSILMLSPVSMASDTVINVGGLIGNIYADTIVVGDYLISNSYATGNIIIDAEYTHASELIIDKLGQINAGGFIGIADIKTNTAIFSSCFASGFTYIAALNEINAGGFAGYLLNENAEEPSEVNLCYSSGNVTAKNGDISKEVNLGGLIGKASMFSISDCFTISSVLLRNTNNTNSNIGSVLGLEGATNDYSYNYYNDEMSGLKSTNAIDGVGSDLSTVIPLTTFEFSSLDLAGYELSTIYPTLKLKTVSTMPFDYNEEYNPMDLSHFNYRVGLFNDNSQAEGTKINPATISSLSDFNTISANSNKHFIQTENIEIDYKLLTKITNLNGTYNANGYLISLSDTSTEKDFKSLFGTIDGYNAGIYNLSLRLASDLETSSETALGILASTNNGHIVNSGLSRYNWFLEELVEYSLIVTSQSINSATGTVTGINNGNIFNTSSSVSIKDTGVDFCNGNIGGLTGKNNALIEMSNYSGEISVDITESSSLGGIAGYNDELASVYQSFVSNEINALFNGTLTLNVGGLIGQNIGSINECYSSNEINITNNGTTLNNVGGLVGRNYNDISTAYSTSKVTVIGYANTGGFIGMNSGGEVTNAYSSGDVGKSVGAGRIASFVGFTSSAVVYTNCYAIGYVNYVNAEGEIDGSNITLKYTNGIRSGFTNYTIATPTFTNCYFDKYLTSVSDNLSIIEGITAVDGMTADGESAMSALSAMPWVTRETNDNVTSYPYLYSLDTNGETIFNDSYNPQATGSRVLPFLVSDIEEWEAVISINSGACILTTDLIINNITDGNILSLDSWIYGNGHKITLEGIKATNYSAAYIYGTGLFTNITSDGLIRDLTIDMVYNASKPNANNIQSLNTINSDTFAFGLLAAVNNGRILNINSEPTLSTVKYSFTQETEKDMYFSGFVGLNESTGIICNVISTTEVLREPTAVVSETAYTGAITGLNKGLIYNTEANSYLVEINDIYTMKGANVKYINTSDDNKIRFVGGLVGYNTGYITNSYSDNEITVETNSKSYVGGFVGYATSVALVTSKIVYCYSSSFITAKHYQNSNQLIVGGFVGGVADTEIANSYASGSVNVIAKYATGGTNYSYVGGFVGETTEIEEQNTKISNAYATGDVMHNSLRSYTGGFVGYSSGAVAINSAYAIGPITTTNTDGSSGGFLGYSSDNTGYIKTYFDAVTTKMTGANAGATIMNTRTLMAANLNSSAWSKTVDHYPLLKGTDGELMSGTNATKGSRAYPYPVTSIRGETDSIEYGVSMGYNMIQTATIEVTESIYCIPYLSTWYNGNGYTINWSNNNIKSVPVYIDSNGNIVDTVGEAKTSIYSVGLFGILSPTALLFNAEIVDWYYDKAFQNDGTQYSIGSFAGVVTSYKNDDIQLYFRGRITSSKVTGTMNILREKGGLLVIGGLVGMIDGGQVDNCAVKVLITTEFKVTLGEILSSIWNVIKVIGTLVFISFSCWFYLATGTTDKLDDMLNAALVNSVYYGVNLIGRLLTLTIEQVGVVGKVTGIFMNGGRVFNCYQYGEYEKLNMWNGVNGNLAALCGNTVTIEVGGSDVIEYCLVENTFVSTMLETEVEYPTPFGPQFFGDSIITNYQDVMEADMQNGIMYMEAGWSNIIWNIKSNALPELRK